MIVYPVPKKWVSEEGTYPISRELCEELRKGIDRGSKERLGRSFAREISFRENQELSKEGYLLAVFPEGIEIEYQTEAGAFYALTTLRQMIWQIEEAEESKTEIPCCQIEDEPDFSVRGIMLDISRNKIPTLETLYELVDLFAMMKLNHLELYLEGFSFAYPSFEALWRTQEDNMPFTGEEIRALDAYCKERFLDLTPNQNCLGHMNAWLAPGAFPDLAEKPEGGNLMGVQTVPGTLDPSDLGSLKLVEQMMEDLLPCFTSKNFNVDLDEPFELGQGKNRKRVEQEGIGAVYLEYVEKIYELVKKRGKHMLIWGDILTRHPELLPLLPEDITVLDWNYDAVTPFEGHAKMLSEAKRDFWVCPGSSAWSSFTGRTENMLNNIRDAAVTGKRYGASGLLLTDWGDAGHMNPLPFSYPAYLYAAALAWNTASLEEAKQTVRQTLTKALDCFVYQDIAGVMGEVTLRLGEYQQFEEYPMTNMTLAGTVFWFVQPGKSGLKERTRKLVYGAADMICDPVGQKKERELLDAADGVYKIEELIEWLQSTMSDLKRQQMKSPDRELLLKEYHLAAALTEHCAKLRYVCLEEKTIPTELLEELQELKNLLSETWLARNKKRGLGTTMSMFSRLVKAEEA